MGVFSFGRTIQIATLKTKVRVENSQDPILNIVGQDEDIQRKWRKNASFLGMELPKTAGECDAHKDREKEKALDDWGRLSMQGDGVEIFRKDCIGNLWLSNPSLRRRSRMIDAIRLRTKIYGTKVVLAQANPSGMDISYSQES